MVVKVDPKRVVTQTDFVHLARRRFLKGERIDVAGLAAELGISRATAYRWAGNADELTGRVVETLVIDTFELCRREAKGKGAALIVEMYTRGLRYMSTGPYRAWLESTDVETALRLVASKHAPVQGTMIRLWEEFLTEEVSQGSVELPTDPHTMAYAMVRIGESFLYADLVAGEDVDVEKAAEMVKLLVS
jgi:AcrR family transcriptional regulator